MAKSSVIVKLMLRNGRYYLRIIGPGGEQRRSLKHGDRAKAVKQARLVEIDLNAGRPDQPPQVMKISDLRDCYAAAKKFQHECTTADLVKRAFGFLIDCCGDQFLGHITDADGEMWQNYLVSKAGQSRVSANLYLRTVKPAFNWAVKRGWIDSSPLASVSRFRIDESGQIRTLSITEATALVGACPDIRWKALAMIGLTAGLRAGEAINLTVSEIDFKRSLISLRSKRETAATWQWGPKGKTGRTVPLTADCAGLLAKLIDEVAAVQPYLLIRPHRYRQLQSRRAAGKMSDLDRRRPEINFAHDFRKIAERAKLPGVSFHCLRKTCITNWAQSRFHAKELAKLAGHSSITTTMEYYIGLQSDLIERATASSAAFCNCT